jgi:hypothetical protein
MGDQNTDSAWCSLPRSPGNVGGMDWWVDEVGDQGNEWHKLNLGSGNLQCMEDGEVRRAQS